MKRTALSGLGLVTATALLINTITYFVYFFLVAAVAGIIIPILGIAILTLLATGFVASRVRFAPLAGAILVLITTGLDLSQPETIYNLAHPVPVSFFATSVVILASALVAGVGGIGATIQHSRTGEQRPRLL